MISIQSIMLVALGFLSAVLAGLVVAPAFWRRAVRLTTQRLKEQLPLSEAEIRADKDRLRAEYAIRVHRLEMKVEQANLLKARQTIEINRRDGMVSQLEQEQVKLLTLVDENQNARRVLEQTVADRLPKVEARLNEAKTLLFNRDREIAELTQSTKRQMLALDEAHSINAQQTAELDRLTNALTVRGARNQQALVDPNFEGELALRAEIEALRGKTREQAGLIGRLQSQMGRGALLALGEAGPAPHPALNAVMSNGSASAANGQATDAKPAAGTALSIVAGAPDEQRAAAERDVRSLRAKIDDQGSEIARLTAELATLRSGAEGESTGLKDSKIALKARLNAAQAQTEQNTETIKRLRAELAGANERLALQGAHFMEQMRRLGAGTLPAAGQTRRPVTQGQKLTLAERVSQGRTSTVSPAPAVTPAPTPAPVATVVPISAAAAVAEKVADKVVETKAAVVANGHLNGHAPSNGHDQKPPAPQAVALPQADAAPTAETATTEPPVRKQRLIDRISNIDKA